MHQGAGDRGSAPASLAAVPLQHPAQRATEDLLDVRRGHRDDLAGRAQRRVGGQRGEAVPVVRVRRRGRPASASRASWAAARARRGGARACGSGPSGAHTARRSSPTSSASTRARPGRCTGRPTVALVGGQRIQLVEEPRRLLVAAALHRADQQGLPRPGARDVEQPPLLGEQRRDPRHGGAGGLGDPGERGRPAARCPAGCRAAAGPARRPPGRRARRRRRHSRPRAACAVSSATASRRGVRAASVSPGSCWSARYSVKAATSAPGSRSAKPRGGVEEREDGVEVAVGGSADRAAAGAGVAPALLEAAGLPDPPEHLLGALAVAGRVAGDGEQRRRPGAAGRSRGRAARRAGPAAPGGGAQRLDQQRVAPDPLGLGGAGRCDQRPPAQRRRHARPRDRRRRRIRPCVAAPPPRHPWLALAARRSAPGTALHVGMRAPRRPAPPGRPSPAACRRSRPRRRRRMPQRVGRAQRRGEQRRGGVGVELVRAAPRSAAPSAAARPRAGGPAAARRAARRSARPRPAARGAAPAARGAPSARAPPSATTARRRCRCARRSRSAIQPASCAAEVNTRTDTRRRRPSPPSSARQVVGAGSAARRGPR